LNLSPTHPLFFGLKKAHNLRTNSRKLKQVVLDVEIASTAQDFMDKPPEHAMTGYVLAGNSECLDLDFSDFNGDKHHFPTGTVATIRAGMGPGTSGKCRKLLVSSVDNVKLPKGFNQRADGNGRRLADHTSYTGTRTAMALIIRFTDGAGAVTGALADDATRKTYAETVAYKLFGTDSAHASAADATHADTWKEVSSLWCANSNRAEG
jgi:hypothetical protein